MKEIWYLLRCPEGNEADCTKRFLEFVDSKGLKEISYFQCQRMMRYGGSWHLEKRTVLPGYIFLSGENVAILERHLQGPLIPCEAPYLKGLCQNGNLIGISKGIIRKGITVVTDGPLKGRERLIRKIDRHKRTAQIEIPFKGDKKQITVGLEIYTKEI